MKPPHSRRVNSERYLVANGFLEEDGTKENKTENKTEKGDNKEREEGEATTDGGEKEKKDGEKEKETDGVDKGEDNCGGRERLELVIKLMEKIHKEGFTYETAITALVPVEWLKNDILYFSFSFLLFFFVFVFFFDWE